MNQITQVGRAALPVLSVSLLYLQKQAGRFSRLYQGCSFSFTPGILYAGFFMAISI